MQKKLTITLDEEIYHRLHTQVGRGRISQFIAAAVQPHLIDADLMSAYQQMSENEERETEAHEWAEALIGDVDHEAG